MLSEASAREMVRCGVWRCCLNCDHHHKETSGCKLAPDQPIPSEVIVLGCAAWTLLLPF